MGGGGIGEREEKDGLDFLVQNKTGIKLLLLYKREAAAAVLLLLLLPLQAAME